MAGSAIAPIASPRIKGSICAPSASGTQNNVVVPHSKLCHTRQMPLRLQFTDVLGLCRWAIPEPTTGTICASSAALHAPSGLCRRTLRKLGIGSVIKNRGAEYEQGNLSCARASNAYADRFTPFVISLQKYGLQLGHDRIDRSRTACERVHHGRHLYPRAQAHISTIER